MIQGPGDYGHAMLWWVCFLRIWASRSIYVSCSVYQGIECRHSELKKERATHDEVNPGCDFNLRGNDFDGGMQVVAGECIGPYGHRHYWCGAAVGRRAAVERQTRGCDIRHRLGAAQSIYDGHHHRSIAEQHALGNPDHPSGMAVARHHHDQR